MRRRGWTLVELLVALALTAVLGTLLLGAARGTVRLGAAVEESSDRDGARRVAAALLRHALESAGRGGLEPALRFEADGAGERGDVLHVAYRREAWHVEPVTVRAAYFAATDGAGRPNLYRRPEGAVRQPLVLGVEALRVVGGVAPDGRTLTRADLVDGVRLEALRVRLRDAWGQSATVTAQVGFAPRLQRTEAAP